MTQPAKGAAAPRDAALTRLRFFLIGWVILYHLDLPLRVSEILPAVAPLIRHGYLGVDGFFLLSGFALWLGYGARPPRGIAGSLAFLRRRIAKIWPLHALALVILALLVGLVAAAGGTIRDPERFGATEFLLQLFLINAWETSSRFAWNYPSWALSVEWAGYLAFPLVIGALGRLPRWAVLPVPMACYIGLEVLAGWVPGSGLNYTFHLGLVRFALEFVGGMGLGRAAAERMLPRWLLWAALPLFPIGLWLGEDPLAVVGLAALIPSLHRPAAAAPARLDVLLRLGEASFGVYLCWVFVEAALTGVLRLMEPSPVERIVLMLAGFVANLIAGWLAWRFIEVPAHAWLLGRRASHSAAAALAEQRSGG